MSLPFSKYHGTGNDFILVDGRDVKEALKREWIAALCHRHMGIGADGLIIVTTSAEPDVDYIMDYYNADGNIGSMCGNGARCAFHFAKVKGIVQTIARFTAYDGLHTARSEDGNIAVSLNDVRTINHRPDGAFVLNTGSPHYVRFVGNIEEIDVYQDGRDLRYGPEFAEKGINVNFAQLREEGIRVRTYERGVEDITMSCGTGVTAVALAFASQQKMEHGPVRIITDGGSLAVDFVFENDVFKDIYLIGPAVKVFDGSIPR